MHRPVLFLSRFRTVLARRLALPLAAILFAFSYAGCLSTNVNVRSDGTTEGAGVLVRVFADGDAAKAGHVDESGTLVELFSLDNRGQETFLQRSLASEWGVSELPPGNYRLRVVAVVDRGGHIRETHSGDRETDFGVKAGQTAEVKIILKKTPTGLIVAASVTVIVLVVALAIILGKHEGKPPLPPGLDHLPLPPPPPFGHIVVAPEIWVVPVGGPVYRERRTPPRVTSVIPEPDSLVSAGLVSPTLTVSQPLDEARLRPDTILMLGSKSGLVPGTTTVRRGLLRYEPSRELLPGETVTVTVRAAGVVNPDGTRLEEDFSWSFRVAR